MFNKLKTWFQKKNQTYIKYTMNGLNPSYEVQVDKDGYTEFASLLYFISSPVSVYKLIQDMKIPDADKKSIYDLYNLLIATEQKLTKDMGNRPVIRPSQVFKE